VVAEGAEPEEFWAPIGGKGACNLTNIVHD